jgi:microcompartment protein CcmK/EutM
MHIARVMGTAVSTVKDERLEGAKLLLVNEADQTGEIAGKPYVALDRVGAGEGELVLIVTGSTARVAAGNENTPVDAVVVGILDSLRHDGELTYQKS